MQSSSRGLGLEDKILCPWPWSWPRRSWPWPWLHHCPAPYFHMKLMCNITLHTYSRQSKLILGSLCLKNKVITYLHWNEVILCCLKFKYQKPNPRGFRIVLNIKLKPQQVLDWYWTMQAFKANLIFSSMACTSISLEWVLFSNLTTTKICSLYCLLLIITWQLNGMNAAPASLA